MPSTTIGGQGMTRIVVGINPLNYVKTLKIKVGLKIFELSRLE